MRRRTPRCTERFRAPRRFGAAPQVPSAGAAPTFECGQRARSGAPDETTDGLFPARQHAVLGGARRCAGRRGRAGAFAGRHRAGPRRVLRAHAAGDRRLPSLLLAPVVQDVARVPAGPRRAGAELGAEGRALVGEPPPAAPQIFGHALRRALTRAARLLVFAPRLDPERRVDRHRSDHRVGPGPLPRAAPAEPQRLPDAARRRPSPWRSG
jgi:hypothetical protein